MVGTRGGEAAHAAPTFSPTALCDLLVHQEHTLCMQPSGELSPAHHHLTSSSTPACYAPHKVPPCTRSADCAHTVIALTVSSRTSSLCCCSQIIFQPHVETTVGNQPRERLGGGQGKWLGKSRARVSPRISQAASYPPSPLQGRSSTAQPQRDAGTPHTHSHSAQSPTEGGGGCKQSQH